MTCCHTAFGQTLPQTMSRRRALALLGGLSLSPMLSGCDRVAGLIVSDDMVEELGIETWARLRAQMPVSSDQAAQAMAERIAVRLVESAGGNPAGWEVTVFAQPDVNAFVLPGRKIGLMEGMFRVAASEDELAAVIGHEIGHLEAEHASERIGADVIRHRALQMISFLLEVNEIAFAREIAAVLGVGAEFGLIRPYGRRQELEADSRGLYLMADAGYDPRAAITLWERMDARDGGLPALLSTHPAPRDRIEALADLVPEVLAAR